MTVQPKNTETAEDKAFFEAITQGEKEMDAGLGIPVEKAIADLLNWRSRAEKQDVKA